MEITFTILVQLLLSLTFVVSYGLSEQNYDYSCVNKHGDYLAHPSDCSKFLHCSHGRAYEFKCPGNLLWHQNTKSCDYPYRTKCEHESKATKAKLTTKQNSATTVNILKLSAKEILVSADKMSKSLTTTVISELSTKGNPITSDGILELSTEGNSITSDKFLEFSTKGNPITSDDILELSIEESTSLTENIPKISKDERIVIASKYPELIAKEITVPAAHITEISTTSEIIAESITLPDHASFTVDDISEVSMEAGTVTNGTMSITPGDCVSFTANDVSVLSTEATTSTFGTVTELSTDLTTEGLPELFIATSTKQVLNNVTANLVPQFSTELNVLIAGITESSIDQDIVALTGQYMESFTIDINDQLPDNITVDNALEADTLTAELATESSIDLVTVKLTEHYMDLLTINFSEQSLENTSENTSTELNVLIADITESSIDQDIVALTEQYMESFTIDKNDQLLDDITVDNASETDTLTAEFATESSTGGGIGNFTVTYTVNPTGLEKDRVTAELSTLADTVEVKTRLMDASTEKTYSKLSIEADQQLSTEPDFLNLKEPLAENTTEANMPNFKELLIDNTTATKLTIVNISELLTKTDTVNLTAGTDLQISTKETSITTKNLFEIIEYHASTTITPTMLIDKSDKHENSYSENSEHITSQDKTVLKLQGKNLDYVEVNETVSATVSTITISNSITANSQPFDTTTQDPRLPFRAIECQGENNRRQFKAMACYQYYQCFAGWAFLLNCHEGWRFTDEIESCVQDVDKECGY